MATIRITCAHCGKDADLERGHVNRARQRGMRLFCGRKCGGLGRRKPPVPKSVRRLLKAIYDTEYRKKNRALLKAKKAAYFQRTYDPAAARIERKKRAAAHAEYCRRPEYRRWKQSYDRKHLAKKNYGPFAEAALLTMDLNRTIKEQMNGHEIRQANGTCNKTQERRRAGGSERGRPRNRPSNRVRAA